MAGSPCWIRRCSIDWGVPLFAATALWVTQRPYTTTRIINTIDELLKALCNVFPTICDEVPRIAVSCSLFDVRSYYRQISMQQHDRVAVTVSQSGMIVSRHWDKCVRPREHGTLTRVHGKVKKTGNSLPYNQLIKLINQSAAALVTELLQG